MYAGRSFKRGACFKCGSVCKAPAAASAAAAVVAAAAAAAADSTPIPDKLEPKIDRNIYLDMLIENLCPSLVNLQLDNGWPVVF